MAQDLPAPEQMGKPVDAPVWTNQKWRGQPDTQIIPVNLLYADFVSQESLENSVCNFISSWFSQFWIELHHGPQPRDMQIGVPEPLLDPDPAILTPGICC